QTQQTAGLTGVVTGRTDDVLGNDVALRRVNLPLPGCSPFYAERLRVLVDLGARLAGSDSQRHRQVGGCNMTVVRVIQGTHDCRRIGASTELQERPELFYLGRCDDLERDADGVRRTAVLLVLVH